jgi:hypothetical protein
VETGLSSLELRAAKGDIRSHAEKELVPFGMKMGRGVGLAATAGHEGVASTTPGWVKLAV